MITAIIDYESGNLHSAEKSFQRMARETGAGEVMVTSDPDTVRRADRIVLPGVGAFADCRAGLDARAGLLEAVITRVEKDAVPFLGICVGQQLMADLGREHGITAKGFGWIPGDVVEVTPADLTLKIPHMGWNDLVLEQPHPVLAGLDHGDHAYFVHSFHIACASKSDRLAFVEYGGEVTAVVGRDNMIGTQFHPEKSQRTGLRLIANFLTWAP
ncbi:imidazole glycerol phosphate synthase subunit HisH [Halovulum sp. GXIMD14793]